MSSSSSDGSYSGSSSASVAFAPGGGGLGPSSSLSSSGPAEGSRRDGPATGPFFTCAFVAVVVFSCPRRQNPNWKVKHASHLVSTRLVEPVWV